MSEIDDRLEPNAEAVGALLKTVLADLGVDDKLLECRALLAWEEVAGEAGTEGLARQGSLAHGCVGGGPPDPRRRRGPELRRRCLGEPRRYGGHT